MSWRLHDGDLATMTEDELDNGAPLNVGRWLNVLNANKAWFTERVARLAPRHASVAMGG